MNARNARRKKLSEHVAAGTYRARKPRSHYRTIDIREAVQADLAAQRALMAAHRDRLNDREWAHRESAQKAAKGAPGTVATFADRVREALSGMELRPSDAE